jgi:glycine cleavage system aminomethyltransferase T
VVREVNAVRTAVGVCDVSTLGKIDVQGGDAAAFLDRIYANLISTLPIGRVRYGLMLREDGIVMDDGTVARLNADRYIVSTTTASAAKVMQHMEYARQLLGNTLDVSNSAFAYLACAEFSWQGRPARLFRISFSGELAYELAVPAGQGAAAVQAILAAGETLGVVPYGTEALSVMRIEKGHVAGNELNGTTTAADLGLGKLLSKHKDFIGRVLASRPGLNAPDRPVLVGVTPVNRTTRLYAGAHFLSMGAQPTLENDEGFLSSVAFSPTLGTWIGLGFLSRGASRVAERIRCHDPVRRADVEVRVTSPCFYDSDGERLKS